MLAVFSEREFRTHRRGISIKLFKRRFFAVNEASGVRHTLREQHDRFNRKSSHMRRALTPLLGDGLFVSDGALWAERRAAVAPIVHARNVPTFAPIMCDVAREYLTEWKAAGDGHQRDILFEMGELTAEIIARTIFGSQLGREKTQQIISAFAEYLQMVPTLRIFDIVALPGWMPRWYRPGVYRSAARVHEVIDGVIADARRSDRDGTAMVSQLFAARDETGRPFSAEAVRNEAIVLFMAGHETTANTLAWAFYLISQSPAVRARLSGELDNVLAGRPPSYADVPKLRYTRQIIDETLRLYPPVPFLAREAVKDANVHDRDVAQGEVLFVMPWLCQRNTDVWRAASDFVPERFENGLPDGVPRDAYLPFASGPRVCPGLTFALVEAVLCLATLAQDFEVELPHSTKVDVDFRLTLRPTSPLTMRLIQRRQGRAAPSQTSA